MIKILVLTDCVDEWVKRIVQNLSNYQCRKRHECIEVLTDLFYFSIKQRVSESSRGECWSCAVIDKPVSLEVERILLSPSVKASILHTARYFLQKQNDKGAY